MQTQFKQFKDCKEYGLLRYCNKLYFKIPVLYYIDTNDSSGMYNAVNANTGEIGWIDGLLKVEVIEQ